MVSPDHPRAWHMTRTIKFPVFPLYTRCTSVLQYTIYPFTYSPDASGILNTYQYRLNQSLSNAITIISSLSRHVEKEKKKYQTGPGCSDSWPEVGLVLVHFDRTVNAMDKRPAGEETNRT